MAEKNFFDIFRKKGFLISLKLIHELGCITEAKFYKEIELRFGSVNLFYRSKSDMVKKELIKYSLSSKNEKMISITKKGKEVLKHIKMIETIIAGNELDQSILESDVFLSNL